jgi:hypothetical protein
MQSNLNKDFLLFSFFLTAAVIWRPRMMNMKVQKNLWKVQKKIENCIYVHTFRI